jgi:hypothetical protein
VTDFGFAFSQQQPKKKLSKLEAGQLYIDAAGTGVLPRSAAEPSSSNSRSSYRHIFLSRLVFMWFRVGLFSFFDR